MLLPTAHPLIRVAQEGAEVVATFRDRRWVFPAGDCVLLDVENTTAELLARHIGRALMTRLEGRGVAPPERLVVMVDECDGQQGGWAWSAE